MAVRRPSARSVQLKAEKVVNTGLEPQRIHAAPVVMAVPAAAVVALCRAERAVLAAQTAEAVPRAATMQAQQAEPAAGLQPEILEAQT